MADERPTNGNGFARYRDVEALRHDHQREFDRLEASTAERFDRAHEFYSNAHADLLAAHGQLERRVNEVEAVIDQQRGARQLVYALIGSNVLLALVSLGTIAHLAGVL